MRHINIVQNTLDLSDFLVHNIPLPDIKDARTKLGLEPDDISMLFVGRLGQEKSNDILINFFANKCASNDKLKLFIIGDGPEMMKLKKLAVANKVADRVFFLGRVDHDKLPPYFQCCDLFATASLSETYSISVLEAMASGLYVLQRLDIYNKAQISQGENGDFFVTSEDFDNLVQEFIDKTPAQRATLRNTVTKSTQRYGCKEFASAILNVYERAIAKYNNQ